jgi:hypothetical protein
VSRSAEGYDQAAEDEHLSPDRGMTVLIDGLWIDSYTFWGRTVNQVISGKKVSLDEVRSFVFTKPVSAGPRQRVAVALIGGHCQNPTSNSQRTKQRVLNMEDQEQS